MALIKTRRVHLRMACIIEGVIRQAGAQWGPMGHYLAAVGHYLAAMDHNLA